MNFFSFIYLISIIILGTSGISLYRYYKNLSGIFFLLFTAFSSLWFIFYYLFFNGSDPAILLLYSRLDYALSILVLYSFLGFIIFFHSYNKTIDQKYLWPLPIGATLLFFLYIFTPLIVPSLSIDSFGIYREIHGFGYNFHIFLSLLSVPLIGYFARVQLKKQSYISKIRLKRIIYSCLITIFIFLILQLLLPIFGVWILEKEIIIFFTLFVLYVGLTLKRYYFSPLHQEYGFTKIGVIIISFILSISSLNLIKYFYSGIVTTSNSFWSFGDNFGIIDSIIYVAIYSVFYGFFKKRYLVNESERNLKQSMDIVKQNISNTTSIPALNKITQSSICSIFNTNTSKIILLQENSNFPELISYFSRGLGEKIFINDIVFIEENKSKFDKDKIYQEVESFTMLVFPIFKSESEIIGLFFIGKKPFGDFYTIDEIAALLSFVKFLGLHLKYISTYAKIQEYSMTLDMRIDKKTIEYNDLINKQKEFISMISHEVRSPIGSAVFQIDSLIDDVRINKAISLDEISENLKVIGEQIANIGELLRKLFSVQYFDTRKVVLLKENVDIGLLLEKEFEIYSHMYQNITFIKKISTQIGCVNIDKIHFQQVLTNLLENAIKFASSEDPVILIESSKGSDNTFIINIEDNGSGYGDMDPSLIFEKYSKGNHAKLGLGMGLYLCKRIVTMHEGKITANYGKILKGASFIIEIPI